MVDYIKREDAIKRFSDIKKSGVSFSDAIYLDGVMAVLDTIPAADVREVRRGRWLTTDAYPHHLYCSVCYKTYAKNVKWVNELDLPTNYCPNCGAKMEGGHNP